MFVKEFEFLFHLLESLQQVVCCLAQKLHLSDSLNDYKPICKPQDGCNFVNYPMCWRHISCLQLKDAASLNQFKINVRQTVMKSEKLAQ